MVTTTIKPAAPSLPFPAAAVAECLRDELITAVQAAAALEKKPLPASESGLTTLPIFIDSLSVVETLCVLDDVLPFSVDESVVRAGGYNSIDAAINHVVSRIEKKWNEYYSGGKG